jgi:hypothetical protein
MSPAIILDPDLKASKADVEAITQTVLDYAESWHTGEYQRMERALYPNLAKRILRPHPKTGNPVIEWMDAAELIESARGSAGDGGNPPEITIAIYDVFQDIATVKGFLGCIDYLHLAKVGGRWQIINVLWNQNEKAQDPFNVVISSEEVKAVEQAVMDYMRCWYGAGHEPLPPVLHPALVKRAFHIHEHTSNRYLHQLTASELMQDAIAVAQRDNHPPEDQWQIDIKVFDIFNNIATARAVGARWIDYLHLAKVGDQWQIINILYDLFG